MRGDIIKSFEVFD